MTKLTGKGRGVGGGVAPRVLTEDEKNQIEKLAKYLTADQIADVLMISRRTLYRIFDRDDDVMARYKKGCAEAVGIAGQSLMKLVLENNLGAICFFLKTRGGWKESAKMQVELGLSDEMLAIMNVARNETKRVGDKE